jgi:acetyl-CoA carboxylase biotin carboxyl carrier protein
MLDRRPAWTILAAAKMPTNVTAHITGTVWKIEKKAGDPVVEGDIIVILESMKMEMPIEAPCDGTVASITVKEGEPVDEGKVVAVIN